MLTQEIPNPKDALGGDKAGRDLMEAARPHLQRLGIEVAAVMFDQNRHYIYPVSLRGKTRYVFFDWYYGSAWYAEEPSGQGTPLIRDTLRYDAEAKAFKVEGATQVGELFAQAVCDALAASQAGALSPG